MHPRQKRLLFGVLDLASGVGVLAAVFRGLPARWLPVDITAALLSAALVGSGTLLLLGHRMARRAARWSGALALGVGLVLFAGLALSASHLAGVYGPVGEAGALIFLLAAALVFPYLVALPAVKLLWLGRSR
jgi:hypothetical protein